MNSNIIKHYVFKTYFQIKSTEDEEGDKSQVYQTIRKCIDKFRELYENFEDKEGR